MKYQLYTSSKKTWSAMLAALKKAEKSIYIEMYIFLDDTRASHDFFSLLKSKAHSGVKVVIVADAFGSMDLKKTAIAELRHAGVEILFFSHLLRRTHRKITIIDKKVAFLGGVNIENKTINWRDLQIKLQGKKTVRAILRSFARTYKMCGGKDYEILHYDKKTLLLKTKSLILESLPGHENYSLIEYYKNKIINAKKSIKIVTPYFIPPRWMGALFDDACRRGVEIEIIIPHDTDIPVLNEVNYSYISDLAPLGIKFYTGRKMNHAKILIVDDQEGVVGSQNIDMLSFGRNFEVGVFSRQKEIVEDLVKIFDKWKKQAKYWQKSKKPLNLFERLIVLIFKIFFSVI